MLNFLRSRYTLYIIVGLFVLQSLFVALTARYPMAFDEYARYGVIQLHTTTWLPFLSNVPDSASLYGAVTRDPSFLYDYLLSFPLRIIQLFTDNQTWQILILRGINVALAAGSLLIYWKLIRQLGASKLASNIIILFFSLIPIMPLMAGQITYDNLFFPLTALTLLFATRFVQRYHNDGSIDVTSLNMMLLAGLATSFVKYPFVPALIALAAVIATMFIRQPKLLLCAYKDWWIVSGKLRKTVTIAAVLIGVWFFGGSYGLNIVRYHTPLPDCDVVLGIDACRDYGPWNRDYIAIQAGGKGSLAELPWYVQRWTRQMMMETFFMVGAKFNQAGTVVYYSVPPITVLFITAWTLFIVGVGVLVWRIKYIWSQPALRLILLVTGFYTLVLFARNLQFYLETGDAVAIHGRYVMPFIPAVIAVIVVTAQKARLPWVVPRNLKLGVAALTLLLFLQGGGIVSYIVSTNDDWMWPQSQLARSITHEARDLLSPLVYRK
jgi:hypothetical protein